MREERKSTEKSKEELVFNIQVSVVFVEHIRLISHALKKQHNVTLNEYCTLVFLDALEDKINSTQLAQYSMVKHSTTLFVLTLLEDKAYIYKETNQDDKRAMYIGLTPHGQEKARELARDVETLMTSTFWHSLSVSDYLKPLRQLEMQLDTMRGHSMDSIVISRKTLGLTHAMLFRVVRLMVEIWTETTKKHSGLAFNACRTLLLLELYGQLSPSEISHRLHIARSGISLSLSQLSKVGLIEFFEDQEDGRSRVSRCTSQGLSTAHELLHELRRATIEAYKTYSNDAIVSLNAQHIHMYSDLYHIESLIENSMVKQLNPETLNSEQAIYQLIYSQKANLNSYCNN